MIVIYTQDCTIFKRSLNDAKEDIIKLYGEKIGAQACLTLKGKQAGASFSVYGGPLIRIVTKEEAETIKAKEIQIGMFQNQAKN